MKITVPFEREKETKNTVRFKERDEGDRVGMIYVPKATVRELGDPAVLELTLAAAA